MEEREAKLCTKQRERLADLRLREANLQSSNENNTRASGEEPFKQCSVHYG